MCSAIEILQRLSLKGIARWVRTSFKRFTEHWRTARVWTCPVTVPKHSCCLLSSVTCWVLKGSLDNRPVLTQCGHNLFDQPFLKPQRIWLEIITAAAQGLPKPVSRLPACPARPLPSWATASYHWETVMRTPQWQARHTKWQGWTRYHCKNCFTTAKTAHFYFKSQFGHLYK